MRMDLICEGEEVTLAPTKIVCLLRNYAEHAAELRNQVPTRPRFFLKPPSALLPQGGTILIPRASKEVHHEVELAVVIGEGISNASEEDVPDMIMGYLVMLDLTARDLQDEAKAKGLPWAEAKGFDTFAPYCRDLVRGKGFEWRGRRISLSVNGAVRQDGNTSDMLFPVERTIAAISTVMTLEKGDLVLTGTPAGVGPLRAGDLVEAGIEGIGTGKFKVAQM